MFSCQPARQVVRHLSCIHSCKFVTTQIDDRYTRRIHAHPHARARTPTLTHSLKDPMDLIGVLAFGVALLVALVIFSVLKRFLLISNRTTYALTQALLNLFRTWSDMRKPYTATIHATSNLDGPSQVCNPILFVNIKKSWLSLCTGGMHAIYAGR